MGVSKNLIIPCSLSSVYTNMLYILATDKEKEGIPR